jgi:predicted glycoside hydrolase/deacetylase ChbG (UPF0249 family)
MKITITHADGHKQVETAFNTIEELQKALFLHVPEGVKFETDAPVAFVEEPVEAPKKTVKKVKAE